MPNARNQEMMANIKADLEGVSAVWVVDACGLTVKEVEALRRAIRESGDIAGSGSCKLVGPCGEVECPIGVIAAKRHIHMTPEDAQEFGVADKDIVSVKVDTEGRSLVFGDVVVRVSPKYALAMHIDTDESNAAGCGGNVMGEIVK